MPGNPDLAAWNRPRRLRLTPPLAAMVLGVAALSGAGMATAQVSSNVTATKSLQQYVVERDLNVPDTTFRAGLGELGGHVVRPRDTLGLVIVQVPRGRLDRLRELPGVASVSADTSPRYR